MTLDQLNELSLKEFIEVTEPLLEHCDWVLPSLANSRPFMSLADMQNKLAISILNASTKNQIDALRMHPKLGVGKAEPGFSQSEQKQAGLSNLSSEELALFQKLNLSYENKMDYPFVIAVTGMSKDEILSKMALRIEGEKEKELPIAIFELIKIAQIRVAKLFNE